jgi:hypothetical protein
MNWLSKQPQVIKPEPTMLVTKVFLPDSEIRRTKLSVTSFSELCHELSCNFLTEEERNQVMRLKYRDDRDDWVTFDTEEEFQDAVEILRYERVKNPIAALCVSIHLEEKVPVLIDDDLPKVEMYKQYYAEDLPALEEVELPAIMDKNDDESDSEDEDNEDTKTSESVEEVEPSRKNLTLDIMSELTDDEDEEDNCNDDDIFSEEEEVDEADEEDKDDTDEKDDQDEEDEEDEEVDEEDKDDQDDQDDKDEEDEEDGSNEYTEEMESLRASAHQLSQSVGSLLSQAPHQAPVLPGPAYDDQSVLEPVEEVTIPVQFAEQLKMLADMGIGSTKDNIAALEKNKGDVNAVVNEFFQ